MSRFTENVNKSVDALNETLFRSATLRSPPLTLIISILFIIAALQVAKYTGRFVSPCLTMRSVDIGVVNSLEKFIRYTIIVVGLFFLF